MRKVFPGYYRPNEQGLLDLWQNCIFILDANVLLNLYRYPTEARKDLLKVLQKITERLWIPHQAVLEYQENRLGVIAEQVRRYDEVKDLLERTLNKLRADLGNLQLKKRHSAIDPEVFLTKVESAFTEFVRDLEDSQKGQPDVFDHDELRDAIERLLENKLGEPPENQQWLDEVYKEGAKRYANELPPGYMDKPKSQDSEVYYHRGLIFKREYGDLILWYEVIEKARADERFKHIIFITDDIKEDWWWIVNSRGKKTIGPRPELVDEIISKANVESFIMYNSERFMRYAKEYLGVQIERDSIRQVRDVTQIKASDNAPLQLLQSHWHRLILELQPTSLSALLRDCTPTSMEGNTITLHFSHRFHCDKVCQESYKTKVEEYLSQVLEKPIEIICTT